MTFETTTNHRADDFVQALLPKFLVGTILLVLLYLIHYFSEKISFIFESNITLRNFSSIAFNYYILSVVTGLFLFTWIVTLSRSILIFVNRKFPNSFNITSIAVLFKINVVIFTFTMYIFVGYFIPQNYFLIGLFYVLRQFELFLTLQFHFLPSIVTFVDYSTYSSVLLVYSIEALAIISSCLFVLHSIYYIHRKSDLSSFLSWHYTLGVLKATFFYWCPFIIFYLMIWYNLFTGIMTKLVIVTIVLLLILWMTYKITSTYYYGLTNSWVNNDNSILIFFAILLGFFIFPIVFWYIHDFINIYFFHITDHTLLADFKTVLVQNNLVSTKVYSKPYVLDPLLLLVLTTVAIPRIVFLDVMIIGVITFILLAYMQLRYIITYFKSSFNVDFKEQLKSENEAIYNFNERLKGNFILKILFIIFIVFLTWDVLAVVYNSLIMPLNKSTFPDVSNLVIITQLLDSLSKIQYPFNYFGMLLAIILFIAVLVVFNVVAIQLNTKKLLEDSYSGVLSIFSFSFILVNAYLLYDLQQYELQPLNNFISIVFSNYPVYSYVFLIDIGIIFDTLLVLILLALVGWRIKKRFVKSKPKVLTAEEEEQEQEKEAETKHEEVEEEENIIRTDVDI